MARTIFSGILESVARKNKALKKAGDGKAEKRLKASPTVSKGKSAKKRRPGGPLYN
jgi:hypothetical protein